MKLADFLKIKHKIQRKKDLAPQKPINFERKIVAPSIFDEILNLFYERLSFFFSEEKLLETSIHLFSLNELKKYKNPDELDTKKRRKIKDHIEKHYVSYSMEAISIAGGAVSDFLIEEITGEKQDIKNIDVFIDSSLILAFSSIRKSTTQKLKFEEVNENAIQSFLKYIFKGIDIKSVPAGEKRINFIEYNGRSNSISAKRLKFKGYEIDIIIAPENQREFLLIEGFDFAFRSAFYSKILGFHLNENCYRSIKEKTLYINNFDTPLSTLIRGYEFEERYGFSFPDYYKVYIFDAIRGGLNKKNPGEYEDLNIKEKQVKFQQQLLNQMRTIKRNTRKIEQKVKKDLKTYFSLVENEDPLFLLAKYFTENTLTKALEKNEYTLLEKFGIIKNKEFKEIDILEYLSRNPLILKEFNKFIPIGEIKIKPKINKTKKTPLAIKEDDFIEEIAQTLLKRRNELKNFIKIQNVITSDSPREKKEKFIRRLFSIKDDYMSNMFLEKVDQKMAELLYAEIQQMNKIESEKRSVWFKKMQELEILDIPYLIFSDKAYIYFKEGDVSPLSWNWNPSITGRVIFLNELDLNEEFSTLKGIKVQKKCKESLDLVEKFERFYTQKNISNYGITFKIKYSNKGDVILTDVEAEGYTDVEGLDDGLFLTAGEINQIIEKIIIYFKEKEGFDIKRVKKNLYNYGV